MRAMVNPADAQGSSEPTLVETRSARLWGLDWGAVLPWSFDGITVEACAFDEALPFMERNFGEIFGVGYAGRFLADPMTEPKRRFCREMDVFLYRDGEREIGVYAGHPVDWSTYYMRIAAFLPEYRNRDLLSRTVEACYPALVQAGCQRIEGDCTPSNVAMTRMLTRLGWLVTSTSNSERWGTLLRFTRFLDADAEDVFARQFCGVRLKNAGNAPAADFT